MEAYQLLKREIRKYIFEEGWESLRKIQEASIKQVVKTEDNLILAAPTASGKTEAAFLPAINDIDDWKTGLQIVYISPLIALINDQFKRIDNLCKEMDIPVTAWHSESSRSQKEKLLKEPSGILLITPESLEAMLSLRSEEAKILFAGTKWVIIDEIHSFLSNNRGLQLKSLLERMQRYMNANPRFIGMSATLHREDYSLAKNFFNNGRQTKVLLDKSKNHLIVTKSYHPKNIRGNSPKALQEIYGYSQKESMLVFPNSRKQVESLSVALNRLAQKQGSHVRYFAHHSSISKDMRLSAESFAKNSGGQLFSIVCTSTLELGIDIGSVDSIVQYEAPHSVASLSQRLGRSGRQTGENILHFIATDDWSLLQGLASISLYQEGKLDRVDKIYKPYDVLAHQVLSLLLEKHGMSLERLKNIHREFSSWDDIEDEEYNLLLDYLIKENYIEILEEQAIVGIETENLLYKGDFFAHFQIENYFSVYYFQSKIGEIPIDNTISKGDNIFLAGQVWSIQSIQEHSRKVIVEKSVTGRPPKFSGHEAFVSNEIRERMFEILESPSLWPDDREIVSVLQRLAGESVNDQYFKWVQLENSIGLRTFKGTKINKTLNILLNMQFEGHDYSLHDDSSLITGPNLQWAMNYLGKQSFNRCDLEKYLASYPKRVSLFLLPYKYSKLLPEKLKIKYIVNNLLDLEGTRRYLQGCKDE